MKQEKQVERLGAVLALLYEFNWPMTESEIMQRTMKFSDMEDLRFMILDLKKAELVTDKVPGSWRLTKKGKDMVKQSLGQS